MYTLQNGDARVAFSDVKATHGEATTKQQAWIYFWMMQGMERLDENDYHSFASTMLRTFAEALVSVHAVHRDLIDVIIFQLSLRNTQDEILAMEHALGCTGTRGELPGPNNQTNLMISREHDWTNHEINWMRYRRNDRRLIQDIYDDFLQYIGYPQVPHSEHKARYPMMIWMFKMKKAGNNPL